MKVKVKIFYPWPGVEDDEITVEIPEDVPDYEVDNICFEYVVDAIFDRGISWDYKEVE